MIYHAITTLLEHWKESAPEQQNSLRLEILRMKIIRIRLSMGNAQQAEDFDGIYTAWRRYGTTTYYMNIGYGDCVAVSRDGTMTVQPSSLLGRTSPGHTTSILRRTSTAQQIAAAVTMPSMYCWMCKEKRSRKRNAGCMDADFKPKSIFTQTEKTKVLDGFINCSGERFEVHLRNIANAAMQGQTVLQGSRLLRRAGTLKQAIRPAECFRRPLLERQETARAPA